MKVTKRQFFGCICVIVPIAIIITCFVPKAALLTFGSTLIIIGTLFVLMDATYYG
jgi:hypothetical protein